MTDKRSPAERVAQLRLDEQTAARRRNILVVAAVVALVVVVTVVGLVVQGRRDSTGGPVSMTPTGVTSDYGVVLGAKDAPHKVVVYEDFQCPICNEFEKATSEKVQAAIKAGKISVEYRMVSFLDRVSKNAYSSRAANASLAVLHVAGPAAFQKFHTMLFENQPAEGTAGPDNAELVDDAVRAGADRGEVEKLIDDGAYDEWVANATDAMSQHGVNGTPSVSVDGVMAKSPAEGLDALLKVV
ncbi:DsbA family protein [Nocardioides jiangxiensis]|uniref:Thioredoxin domain-containing protein n=1 Tax=Nocardioides jiangxiensis TaxID=3064524 RepID=A0ABT9B2U6_9ACTN|nr:thioredoxin domain-containing protein [Nocardioides sp. WY-20]MDO7869018.1 thioredoxin domain-containing protein [Nocardioides sp. WY-20]